MAELEDFEAFLEPSFEPHQFANDLLLATNDDDGELDLEIPRKKLRYDLQECEKRLNKIATKNYQQLVSKLSEVEQIKEAVSEKIGPQLQLVNYLFQRMKTGVMAPYEEGVKLNKALKRIHATSNLLRGAGFFLFLIQQAQTLESTAFTPKNGAISGRNHSESEIVQLANVYAQIEMLFDDENTGKEPIKNLNGPQNGSTNPKVGNPLGTSSSNLRSVKIIREYKSIFLSKRADLISQCVLKISNEMSHASTFNVDNFLLRDTIVALYLLDKKECISSIDKATLAKQTQTVVSNLLRALQSPRNFTSVLEEAYKTSQSYIDTTVGILHECRVCGSSLNESDSLVLQVFLQEKGANEETTSTTAVFGKIDLEKKFAELYWGSLGHKFKKNVAATMARGGPIAKNLRIYHEGINKAVATTFNDDIGAKNIKEAIDLIGSLN